MVEINQLTVYDGILPDKSTQTKEEFADAVYYTHRYVDQSFVPEMVMVIDRMNQLGTELNSQMVYVNFKGEWVAGSVYSLGESASRNSSVYYSKTNSNTGFDPELYPEQWQLSEFIIEKNAQFVEYDNTTSGMAATNVKAAIDELAATRDLAVVTKSFAVDESYNITLSCGVYAPYVGVTKEIVAGGLIDDTWNVNPSGADFDAEDTAYAVTIKPSAVSGLITLTLGSGSFSASDIGKTISFNGGSCVLIDDSPANAYVTTPFYNTSTVNAGEWTMKSVQFDENDGACVSHIAINSLALAGVLPFSYKNVTLTGYTNNSNTVGTMKPDGTKVYYTNYDDLKIYQIDLSVPYDPQSASYNGKYFNVSGITTSPHYLFFADNTHAYLTTRTSSIFPINMTNGDVTTITAGTVVGFSEWIGVLKITSAVFSLSGTKLLVGGNYGNLYSFSLSTPFVLSSKSYDNIYSTIAKAGVSMQLTSDGMSLYSTNGYVKKYALSEANNITNVTLAEQSISLGGATHIIDKSDGQHILSFSRGIYDGVVQIQDWPIGIKKAYEDTYVPVFSNGSGQILTTNWDAISVFDTFETMNGGSVYYSISNDNNSTFYIQSESSTPRKIVRLNGTYWEYNSNTTWGLETWVAASPNTKYQAMISAMGVSINRMAGAQLEASLVNITTDQYLDLAIVLYAPSVDNIPYSDGMNIEYQANSMFKMAVPGVDYEYSHPSPNIVSFKALAANNLKIRIV